MPADWTSVRDRWMSFHRVRVACGLLGLAILIAAAVSSKCGPVRFAILCREGIQTAALFATKCATTGPHLAAKTSVR